MKRKERKEFLFYCQNNVKWFHIVRQTEWKTTRLYQFRSNRSATSSWTHNSMKESTKDRAKRNVRFSFQWNSNEKKSNYFI